MAFSAITLSTVQPGKAVTAELMQKVKNNFDDLDSRITSLAAQSNIVFFNFMVNVGSTAATKIEYFRVPSACTVTHISIGIEDKAPATTGSLTVDLKKSSTLVDANFTSVLSTLPTINVATAPNGTINAGVVNIANQDLAAGDFLRLDITGLPVGLQRFFVIAYGEY